MILKPICIRESVPLAGMTTMGVGGNADFFCEVRTRDELRDVCMWANACGHPITILGGGSNVIIDDAGVRGVVIVLRFEEIVYEEHGDVVSVTVGAGVALDVLVADTVLRGVWGIENLSGIPGTVGALPIQNVGAYGVEAKDVVTAVMVYDPHEDSVKELSRDTCAFAYRHSLFKTEAGKHLIVLDVTLRLTKKPSPTIAYSDIVRELGTGAAPTQREIRDTIIRIRAGKFPDWHTVGTSGSFFKNPILTREQYEILTKTYPELPGFSVDTDRVKIPLGWVLDHVLHYRGYREGAIGLYEKQALVLVRYGEATAEEIFLFAQRVCDRVKAVTDVPVECEVVRLQ